MSFDMMPIEIVNDAVNRSLANVEASRKFGSLDSEVRQSSDLSNLGIIQLGSTVLITSCSDSWENSSTLVMPIPVVVRDAPKKQVVNVDAKWIVTRVTDTFIDWIKTCVNKVSKTMHMPSLTVSFHQPVALGKGSTEPRPTFIRTALLHMLPEVVKSDRREFRYGFIVHSGIIA